MLKIGLTRRLDPEERVRELGDASVPFPFDIHALIYSENAPELETKLHNHFWDRRVNWANDRKEFFQVSLEEVATAIRECGLSAEVSVVPEAKEDRQTVAAIDASNSPPQKLRLQHLHGFPSTPLCPLALTWIMVPLNKVPNEGMQPTQTSRARLMRER